jgi:chromosome segregation protein
VIVRDAAAGRRALARLQEGDSSGAVLALDGASSAGSPIDITGAAPLAPRVRADDPAVESMLRRLLASCAVVDGGWTAALDAALAHPNAVVVTRDGDRFTGRGWRVGLAGPGATAAALDEARDRASVTEADAARARNDLDVARQALVAAREAEVAIGRRLDENDGRLAAAGDALERLESDRRDVATEVEALSDHLRHLEQRRETGTARQLELGEQLSDLEAEEQAAAAAVADRRRVEEALAERAGAVGALRSDLEVRGAAIDDRRRFLTGRRGEVEARLAADEVERAGAQDRRHRTEAAVGVVDRLVVVAQRGLDGAEERLGDLRERRRRQSEVARQIAGRLDGLRRERSMAERALEELRERERRIEIDETETRVRLEGLTETLRHDLDVEPDDAVGSPCPDLAEGVKPAARVRELERELKLMGPVNPLALEEFEALQERHEFLQGQLDDVKSTRRDLAKVIRAVDEEIVEVFAAAFADVAENFTYLFSTLFPGGTGKLRLTEPDDLLATGIEIEGKPAGKNVKKLSLLSGGERSLTALAFLFAVFRSRPSPFYVLDEVEAALDDLNLHRFLELVDEFRREAQLVIVSHQKRTMEAADCLYGVSMQPGGSSKVVSERLSAS